MKEGLFIVFEGPSGTGKTTHLKLLEKRFPNAYFTREPGGTPYGDELRKLVQYRPDLMISPMASTFTYMASRANLVEQQIKPRLKNGQMVISDRYWPSTHAYQGSEGVDVSEISYLAKIATGGLEPHMYIYLDVPTGIIVRRKIGSGDIDRYDEMLAKDTNFLNGVIRRYSEVMALSNNWYKIDAQGSIDETQQKIVEAIERRLSCSV